MRRQLTQVHQTLQTVVQIKRRDEPRGPERMRSRRLGGSNPRETGSIVPSAAQHQAAEEILLGSPILTLTLTLIGGALPGNPFDPRGDPGISTHVSISTRKYVCVSLGAGVGGHRLDATRGRHEGASGPDPRLRDSGWSGSGSGLGSVLGLGLG